MRTCTACGETKPLDAFVRIKGTPYVYGRCKACRAATTRGGRPPRSARDRSHRTCNTCGETKPLTTEFFLPIKKGGFYGRCRVCRRARCKARYHSSEEFRRAEIARALKSKQKRRRVAEVVAGVARDTGVPEWALFSPRRPHEWVDARALLVSRLRVEARLTVREVAAVMGRSPRAVYGLGPPGSEATV